MEFKHYSVMLKETIDGLDVKTGGTYVDGTLGSGGHSMEILKRAENVRLIGIDRDEEAINAAKNRLSEIEGEKIFVHNNFSNITEILDELGIDEIDGMVLDLGVSSYQLDNAERGFSYMADAPLDMRMDKSGGKTAYDVVNEYDENALAKIFFDYGEEKWSKRIAQFIVKRREISPVKTTFELANIVKSAIPQKAREGVAHPEKRVFQAVRIEVNGELSILKDALKGAIERLKSGGRLSVITFHSLEDRIVKQTFSEMQKGCICPPDFPICVCGNKPKIKLVNRKPILPSDEELSVNSRSKSAKLRICEKL